LSRRSLARAGQNPGKYAAAGLRFRAGKLGDG
jgi:hypothetical protein